MKLAAPSRRVSEHKQTTPSVIAVHVYISWRSFFTISLRFFFIKPFRDEKVLIGLPRIALRKSETKV